MNHKNVVFLLLILLVLVHVAACKGSKKASKQPLPPPSYKPKRTPKIVVKPPVTSHPSTVEVEKPALPKPLPEDEMSKKISESFRDSDLVGKAQILLYLSGYAPGRIDGTLKPSTTEALQQFQIVKNLPEGDLTDISMNALGVPLMDFNVADIQTALSEKGYDPGPIDGLVGPLTRSAYTKFLQKHKLSFIGLTKEAKKALFSRETKYFLPKETEDPLFTQQPILKKQVDELPALPNPAENISLTNASIRSVQQALLAKGYDSGPFAQKMTPQLEDALYHYQLDKKLPMGGLNMDTLRSLGFR